MKKFHFLTILLAMQVFVSFLITTPARAASIWYVAPTGDNTNSCAIPGAPCRSLQGALNKAAEDDTIYMVTGVYTDTGDYVVDINKNITVLGGWDSVFTSQEGYTTLDGETYREVVKVDTGVNAVLERLIITRGNVGYTNGFGAGVQNYGSLTMRYCQVINNNAYNSIGDAAGIYSTGDLTLEYCNVSRNVAYNSAGGIYASTGSLTIRHSVINQNRADYGTGISIYRATTWIEDSAIYNNSAISGAGGGISVVDGAIVTINNSTISGNHASYYGGGLYVNPDNCTAPQCKVDLYNVTIHDNHAWKGGGMSANNTLTLHNSVIASNTASESADCQGATTVNSAGYNLIGSTTGCAIALQASDLSDLDAKLGSLLGKTDGLDYVPLLTGSPAIDAGDPAGCKDGQDNLLTSDIRGVPRSGHCDIGSYEYTTPGPASTFYLVSGTPQTTFIDTAFSQPLKAMALDNLGGPAEGTLVTFSAPASGASAIFPDTSSYTTTIPVSASGLVTTSVSANSLTGSYIVTASASGLVTPTLSYQLQNIKAWYVSSAGDDDNDCIYPDMACATLNAALDKALPGGTIYVTAEVFYPYDPSITPWAIELDKPVNLSGGWDDTFTSQVGVTIMDGESVRSLVYVQKPTTIDRFWFRNGRSTGAAGLYCGYTSLTLTNSAFTDNVSTYWSGGAMWIDYCYIHMSNVTIANNSTPQDGGGIYINYGTLENSILTLNNVTISGNQAAGNSGGLYSGSSPVIMQNTLIADNTGTASAPDCSGAITSLGYNLVGNDTGCILSSAEGHLLDLNAGVLRTASAVGFSILKHDSPAVDAGDPTGCKDHLGDPIDSDQRGVARSGRCDIGAYEWSTPGPVASLYAVGGTPQRSLPNKPLLPLQAVALDTLGNTVPGIKVGFAAPTSGPSLTFTETGSYSATLTTDLDGLVSAAAIANNLNGTYTVTAQIQGFTTFAQFNLTNMMWYVSPNGDNSNSCLSPLETCATVGGVLNKPAFLSGDTIAVASGTYLYGINSTKSVRVLGGWNATFTAQNGFSTLDGQDKRIPVQSIVTSPINIYFERFIFTDGAKYNIYIERANLTLQECIVRNTAGIGIYSEYGYVILKDTVVRGNGTPASTASSGIFNEEGSRMEIWNSTITNNLSRQGAGIKNRGKLYINNSTISGNTASGEYSTGGGIYHDGEELVISNSTIASNSSEERGGGIHVAMYASITIQNTILARNQASYDTDCAGKVISSGYNLIGNVSGCNYISEPGDQIYVWDPELGPLDENGGSTPTRLLYATSPAIDRGNPAGCTDHLGNLLTTDQRGEARSQDGDNKGNSRCDIGAFETAYPAVEPPSVATWYVASSGSDSNPCKSASAPCQTINGALKKAKGTDVILVRADTYTASSSAQEVVSISKNIRLSGGWNTTFTKQSGMSTIDGSSVQRCMRLNDSMRLEMDHFILTHGFSGNGAGLATGQKTSLYLRNVIIQNNQTSQQGGGIALGTYSILWMDDSVIQSNKTTSTSSGGGGGIYADEQSTIILHDCTIKSNHAVNGGGIKLGNNDSLYLYNSTVSNNIATLRGGGIYGTEPRMISIYGSLIDQNTAHEGGGILSYPITGFILDRTVVRRNHADTFGGGIRGEIYAINSAFIANTAENGGGIFGWGDLINVTMHSNQATKYGGAFYAELHIHFFNTTIVYNSAGIQGGGVFDGNGPYLEMSHTILAGNSAPSGRNCSGSPLSTGYNLVGTLTGCGLRTVGSDLINVKPLLAPLANPLAKYLIPLLGSPAVDGGKPTGCTSDGATLLTNDQRGASRPQDGDGDGIPICDIGAIEGAVDTTTYLFLPQISK